MKHRNRYLAIAAAAILAVAGAAAAYVFLPLVAPPPEQPVELQVYTWSNYIPEELFDRFTEETGIEVAVFTYESNDELQDSLAAGALYDLALPSDFMVRRLIEADLLLQLDKEQLPNLAGIAPPHDDPIFDPRRRYSVPYLWGTVGFTYDAARTSQTLEESWGEFFEPRDELDGKIGALSDEIEVYSAAAYFLDIDRCTTDAESARRILELLQAQKPHLAAYQSEGTIDAMVTGDVILQQQWNGAAHRTRQSLGTAVYVYPREGVTYWQDNFVIPAKAQHPIAAMTFLNWMMQPETIAVASNFTGYMNAIEGSQQFLDPGLAEDPAVNPPAAAMERLVPARRCSEEARMLRQEVWDRLLDEGE
jgi:spermidine/putrescine transport system substrate-binding protein